MLLNVSHEAQEPESLEAPLLQLIDFPLDVLLGNHEVLFIETKNVAVFDCFSWRTPSNFLK